MEILARMRKTRGRKKTARAMIIKTGRNERGTNIEISHPREDGPKKITRIRYAFLGILITF